MSTKGSYVMVKILDGLGKDEVRWLEMLNISVLVPAEEMETLPAQGKAALRIGTQRKKRLWRGGR
eukprot:6355423-Prorocentrum_lima.AAC.1